MKTYDRNRNAIATGSMVMIAGNGTTGVITRHMIDIGAGIHRIEA